MDGIFWEAFVESLSGDILGKVAVPAGVSVIVFVLTTSLRARIDERDDLFRKLRERVERLAKTVIEADELIRDYLLGTGLNRDGDLGQRRREAERVLRRVNRELVAVEVLLLEKEAGGIQNHFAEWYNVLTGAPYPIHSLTETLRDTDRGMQERGTATTILHETLLEMEGRCLKKSVPLKWNNWWDLLCRHTEVRR